jgi:hypothetical protein
VAGLPGHPLGKNPGDVWRIRGRQVGEHNLLGEPPRERNEVGDAEFFRKILCGDRDSPSPMNRKWQSVLPSS